MILTIISLNIWNLNNEKKAHDEAVAKAEAVQRALPKKSDVNWLALNIYHEARGESLEGMMAVGAVTLNRVKSDKFPCTVKDVVKQKHQFSWYWDGQPDEVRDKESWNRCKKVATLLLSNKNLPIRKKLDGVCYYHAEYVKPAWSRKMDRIIKIGNHIFYIQKC